MSNICQVKIVITDPSTWLSFRDHLQQFPHIIREPYRTTRVNWYGGWYIKDMKIVKCVNNQNMNPNTGWYDISQIISINNEICETAKHTYNNQTHWRRHIDMINRTEKENERQAHKHQGRQSHTEDSTQRLETAHCSTDLEMRSQKFLIAKQRPKNWPNDLLRHATKLTSKPWHYFNSHITRPQESPRFS